MSCAHHNFQVAANVYRLVEHDDDADPHAFCASITIECSDCREPFGFIGVPYGSLPDRPTTSPDHLQLRTPLASWTSLRLLNGWPERPPA